MGLAAVLNHIPARKLDSLPVEPSVRWQALGEGVDKEDRFEYIGSSYCY